MGITDFAIFVYWWWGATFTPKEVLPYRPYLEMSTQCVSVFLPKHVPACNKLYVCKRLMFSIWCQIRSSSLKCKWWCRLFARPLLFWEPGTRLLDCIPSSNFSASKLLWNPTPGHKPQLTRLEESHSPAGREGGSVSPQGAPHSLLKILRAPGLMASLTNQAGDQRSWQD